MALQPAGHDRLVAAFYRALGLDPDQVRAATLSFKANACAVLHIERQLTPGEMARLTDLARDEPGLPDGIRQAIRQQSQFSVLLPVGREREPCDQEETNFQAPT